MKQSTTCIVLVAFFLAGIPGHVASSAIASDSSGSATLTVRKLQTDALEIVDREQPILRYNYQSVPAPSESQARISDNNQKYAVSRSDYIHPLFGPHGEILTDDWVPDHPHHRGICWAWPEVDWQGRRGDLHALQQVFARPTGKLEIEHGPDFIQIIAENEWRWNDDTPIVREQAIIRVYQSTKLGRAIDLELRFTALDTDVEVARREQSHYGGLNLRLSPATQQEITTVVDPPDVTPRRAWADRSGIPQGGNGVVGLAILQNLRNPAYPGDWVQYPEISWLQPTFPSAGSRYTIAKNRPLELRYLLWIHEGKLDQAMFAELWATYNNTSH